MVTITIDDDNVYINFKESDASQVFVDYDSQGIIGVQISDNYKIEDNRTNA